MATGPVTRHNPMVTKAEPPPLVKLPSLAARGVREDQLGSLWAFAEGASAVIYKASIDHSIVANVNSSESSSTSFSSKLSNAVASEDEKMVTVAVKLARSKEGQIREDVEAELRLLYAISAYATGGSTAGMSSGSSSSSSGNSSSSSSNSSMPGESAQDGRRSAESTKSNDNQNQDEDALLSLARGGSKNVIRLLGAGTYHDLRRYIVLEYCASTLEALLDIAEKPPPRRNNRVASSTDAAGGNNNGGAFGWFKQVAQALGGGNRPQLGLAKALKIGFETSLAVAFLHNCAIPGCVVLHRDLKPSNIGLTSSGSVRLLDLGLARAVPIRRRRNAHPSSAATAMNGYSEAAGEGGGGKMTRDGRLLPPYKMTGYTGSLRYRAPEVATDQPYDESVDVYSLSHVLWETASLERYGNIDLSNQMSLCPLTLLVRFDELFFLPIHSHPRRPYKGYNKAQFFESVVRQHKRPPLPGGDPSEKGDETEQGDNKKAEDAWPRAFRTLLKLGWSSNINLRPSSSSVSSCLMQLIIEERYKEATFDNDEEQFEIPEIGSARPPSNSLQGMASGLVSRLSDITTSSRRGIEEIS